MAKTSSDRVGTGKTQELVFFLDTFSVRLAEDFLCVSPLLDSVKLILRGDRLGQSILLTENHVGQIGTSFESTQYASVKALKLFQNCRHLVNTG